MHELRKKLLTCECSHKWVIQGELFIKLLKRYLQLCKYAIQYDYLSQLKTVYITGVCKWKSSLSEQAVVVNQMSMSQSRKLIKWQHIAQISACACQSQKLIIWQHIAHISACQIRKLLAWQHVFAHIWEEIRWFNLPQQQHVLLIFWCHNAL